MFDSIEHAKAENALKMSSYNHAMVQVNLAVLLKQPKKYDVLAELSLEIAGNEVRPDLCLYPRRGLIRPRDVLRMTQMPLLAVEILSPKQGTDDILEKFEVYFGAGIPSCWLVDPAQEVLSVYSAPDRHTVYSQGDVIDESLNIRLPVAEIFE